jgi:hypothetical protein
LTKNNSLLILWDEQSLLTGIENMLFSAINAVDTLCPMSKHKRKENFYGLRKKNEILLHYISVPRNVAIILLVDVLIINSGHMLFLPK